MAGSLRRVDPEVRRERRDFARQLRRGLTDAERRLRHHLRDRRLDGHRFGRQRPIGPYCVDFVCLESKLIVELDGGQHAEAVEYDGERTRFLAERGFVVLRFWDHEALMRADDVLEVIRRALVGRVPSPA